MTVLDVVAMNDAISRHPAAPGADLGPARLSVRLTSLLSDRGGRIEQRHLTGYLATLLEVPEWAVRDVILDEVAAGRLEVSWSNDPGREFHQRLSFASAA